MSGETGVSNAIVLTSRSSWQDRMAWARRSLSGAPYVVCAMFTKDYEHKAERLRASLDRANLDYALFEVPAVHRSISKNGIYDLSLSKPEFIRFAIKRFNKPVLYVDADVCFRSAPALIDAYRGDFAIFNWLASSCTDAWVPVTRQNTIAGKPPRYWQFSHSVDDWSETQLICSGCTQYWAPTLRAGALLDRWRELLWANPRAQDDHCLDVAFNFRPRDGLRFWWLPNEYARYAFWIFSDPVIDHPDFPTPVLNDFEDLPGGRAIAAQIKLDAGKPIPIPRTMILDAYSRSMIGQSLAGKGTGSYLKIEQRLFLPAGISGAQGPERR